jgi:hypothetical protein
VTAEADNRRPFGFDGGRTVPGHHPSLLAQAGIAVVLAIPLLDSGPGWVRVAAVTLTGGSLSVFVLTCAVSLLMRSRS